VRQARAQVEIAAATRDQLAQQISLQVWQAYFALQTAEKSISNTDILFKSSEQSMQQASGQYKAGVGNILMVLTAQASLANARVQSIQARLNWYTALAQLAAAVGTLDAT
jgi:outer membrane protein TolC